ncbi:MAG: hypothetical protein A2W19_03840 [Spirochaetes bacterium RBG_16_49_21]|nr:MAG: hypothetical protein A2W19_03840 [Spirochaetes bacterium RBG_16_49_21]
MNKRHFVKYIHEGEYVAEVDVELIDTAEGWAPYLSLDDAEKLDEVRIALRSGDLKARMASSPSGYIFFSANLPALYL